MSEYGQYIWNYLLSAIGNEYGVAGLMGNLQAESGLIPYRLQGDFTSGYSKSISYTNGVNNGSISKNTFVNDSKGYGLAQWTFSSRKEALYNLHISTGYGIGSVELACQYLMQELNSPSYSGVLNVLRTANTIRQASDKVLHDFENPREQGPEVEAYREQLSIAIYNEYSGGGPVPPPPTPTKKELPIWLICKMGNQ